MGRKKKIQELKKKTISVTIDREILIELDELELKSKSELVNLLLREYLHIL